METPTLWKELKTDFTHLSEGELRAALCRVQHYVKQEVAGLRPEEVKVKDWLDTRGARSSSNI